MDDFFIGWVSFWGGILLILLGLVGSVWIIDTFGALAGSVILILCALFIVSGIIFLIIDEKKTQKRNREYKRSGTGKTIGKSAPSRTFDID